MPLKAPPVAAKPYDWGGFYLGGHLGAAWGHSDWSAAGGLPVGGSFDLTRGFNAFKGTGSYFARPAGGLQCDTAQPRPAGSRSRHLVPQHHRGRPDILLRLRQASELRRAGAVLRHRSRAPRLRSRQLADLRDRRLRLQLRRTHPHATGRNAGWWDGHARNGGKTVSWCREQVGLPALASRSP